MNDSEVKDAYLETVVALAGQASRVVGRIRHVVKRFVLLGRIDLPVVAGRRQWHPGLAGDPSVRFGSVLCKKTCSSLNEIK